MPCKAWNHPPDLLLLQSLDDEVVLFLIVAKDKDDHRAGCPRSDLASESTFELFYLGRAITRVKDLSGNLFLGLVLDLEPDSALDISGHDGSVDGLSRDRTVSGGDDADPG